MGIRDDLTPLESRLVECAAAGEELDCAPTGVTTAEFDQIDDWEERKIRAWVLVALCTGEVPDWSVHPRRGLQLRGAYIAGRVDLSRAQMTQCPLDFHTCRFEEDVVLYQATSSDLSFTSCALTLLNGVELDSSASLHMTKTRLREMLFDRASFRGIVQLSEVRLSNPGGEALRAHSISAGDVNLLGTHVEGEVGLVDANISGQLACTYRIVDVRPERACLEVTTLSNPGGKALNADGISAGNVFLLGATHVNGEVRLLGANIRHELACLEGTTLSSPGGEALNADGISARSVILRRTHVNGEVRLLGANIRYQLACLEGTTLSSLGGEALNAEGCHVGGTLIFRLGEAAVGTVSLAYAQVGTLAYDLASWPDTYDLVGFSYHSLAGDQDLAGRLRWISNSSPFSPHVYTQLAEVYRRSGHEGLARQVAIRREQGRGRQRDLSRWVRAWSRFLGLTVAYGYQPWRALVPLVVLFVVGSFLFSRPPAQKVMVHPSTKIERPISAATCHKFYPCFSPSVYVLDILLPIVDLNQERNWVPARTRPWGGWYEVLTWVLIASGWILTTAVVAGIGSLWRRE